MKVKSKLPFLLCVFVLTACSTAAKPTDSPTTHEGASVGTEQLAGDAFSKQIVLSSPPEINLADALSSTIQEFHIRSGNYKWTTKKWSENQSVVACGAAPLDEMTVLAELVVPEYNRMDKVMYMVGAPVSPDRISVKSWSVEDIGFPEREALSVVEADGSFVELQKNMVYELTLIWEEDNLEQRGFAGEAAYVLKTR